MFHEQHLNWRDMEHPTISQQLERLDGGVNSALRIIPAPKSDRYQEISCGTRKVGWGLSGPVVWRHLARSPRTLWDAGPGGESRGFYMAPIRRPVGITTVRQADAQRETGCQDWRQCPGGAPPRTERDQLQLPCMFDDFTPPSLLSDISPPRPVFLFPHRPWGAVMPIHGADWRQGTR